MIKIYEIIAIEQKPQEKKINIAIIKEISNKKNEKWKMKNKR